ncbi:uro-adherence factor A-like [Mercenaria mercenaria]|uniref:uro-adherence factor A-like n=1 Tax=Mercenaria mercenaria TaxID=6596 RepID=UPI00234EDFF8|nr:uro-adherence factor A-like [Mercenaria mercenaria]
MDRVKKKGKAKVNKPLAERRRRARINDALLQLKSIVLQSISNEQSTLMSKLEKADILEMTVEYIHKMQLLQGHDLGSSDRQYTPGTNAIVLDGSQYTTGFNECTSHVVDCIRTIPDDDISNDNIRTRLLEHLTNVASTADFRNKGKQNTIDAGERKVDPIESQVSNRERDVSVPYTVLQGEISNAETSVNVATTMLQHEVSNVGYTVSESEVSNAQRDINTTYQVLQSGVFNFEKDVNVPYIGLALQSELSNVQTGVNVACTKVQNEGYNSVCEMSQCELSNTQTDENTAQTMLQNELSNIQRDVNTAFTMLQSEVSNTMSHNEVYNAAYTMPQNEVSNTAYTMSQSELSNVAYSMSQSEVSDTAYTMSQSELSNVAYSMSQSKVSNTAYTMPQSEISNVAYSMSQSEVSDTAYTMSQNELSNRDYTKSQTVAFNVERDVNGADAMLQYEASDVKRDEHAAYVLFQAAGKPDMNDKQAEMGTDEIKVDDSLLALNDSKIINIPKKRKVLGNHTNIVNNNRTENTKRLTKTALFCGVKPQIKSPKKSKKGSTGKDFKGIPKPIKKRITASVYEHENKTCNNETENDNSDQVLTFTNNKTESTDKNQAPCVPNDYNYKMMYSNQPEGAYLNNVIYGDSQYILGSSECNSHPVENSGLAIQENYYHVLQQNENELPRMNTMQQFMDGYLPQKHTMQTHSESNIIANMAESNKNIFYQHIFANNRPENVWRPW